MIASHSRSKIGSPRD